MHYSNAPRILLLLLCAAALTGCGSDWFGPEDYTECVLRGTGNETNVATAAAVRENCRQKFPGRIKQQRSRDLPPEAVKKIRYGAELYFNHFLNGTIYNNNSNYLITEVLIAVETVKNGKKTAHVYNKQVLAGPKQSDDFGLEVDSKEEIVGWHIASARGIQQ